MPVGLSETDTCRPGALAGHLNPMQKRRLAWIALAAIAIVLVVTVLALWAFSSGGEEPGADTGETVTTQTP